MTAKKSLIYASFVFLAYFIYFRWIVNPPLFLIKNYREFFTDTYFFRRYFDFPSNPAEYISRFLTHLFAVPVLASLVVTLLLASIYGIGLAAFRKEKSNPILSFLPVLVLMVMHNNYSHSLKLDVDMLLLFSAAWVYFQIGYKSQWFNLALFPLLLSALLFVNGPMTALLFVLVALAATAIRKKKIIHLPVILLESLAVWILFQILFSLSLHDFRQELEDILRVYPFSYLPFILFASVLILTFFYDRFNLLNFINRMASSRNRTMAIAGIFSAAIAVILLTFNYQQKMSLSVQDEAIHQNWDKVLDYSRKCDFPDKNVAYYTNEALFRTGRIYDELFRYNQTFGSEGLAAAEITNYSEIAPNQQVCLGLGALSLSVVWGTEATNVYGANPYVLKNLTKAYLAEGCIKEAQKMLNLLNHTLFNAGWVSRYQKLVDDTTLISADPELLSYKKAQLPAAFVSTKSVGLNLYLLARNTNTNKMAYDYLLISSMLDNRIEDFGTCLTGLKTFGYTTIPKLYIEGLLYHSLFSERSPINIKEFSFDRNLINRFKDFKRDYLTLKDRPEEARKKLKLSYGNTYWYYMLFDCPVTDDVRKDISSRMS